MTVALDRADITERTEAKDRRDATPRKLPTEATDAADPTDPSESTEPTDPMERIEPRELIDRIEPVELIDHREPRGASSMRSVCPVGFGHALPAVFTTLPAGLITYQTPPALVSAWPLAWPGALSGGHRYSGQPS